MSSPRDATRIDAGQLYDAYLDAAMAGELVPPEQFLRERGIADEELAACLDQLYRQLSATPTQPRHGPSPSSLQPGMPEQLGEFRLIETLGQGGMGVVYRAEQQPLGRQVALKVIRPEFQLSGPAAERFSREAQAVARLRHPGIVGIFGVGEQDGIRYIAMELVPGQGLDELFADGAQPVPTRQLLGWIAGVARALQAAHDACLLHRDVKPSNIRITPDQLPVLLDFGLARDAEGPSDLTRSFLGTPAYVSPEQLAGQQGSIDGRTDVYSLGVTLYQGLTGRLPFSGSMDQLVQQVLTGEITPPRALASSISRDLETVTMTALARDPDQRYQTAGALADDLEALLALRPIRARPPGPLRRASQWARRNAALSTALCLATLMLLAMLGYLAWDDHQRRATAMQRAREQARAAERRQRHLALQLLLARHARGIAETRALFYHHHIRLQDRLAHLRRQMDRLTAMTAKPMYAKQDQLWTVLGAGRFLLGDWPEAERAFSEAMRLGSTDPWVPYYLGRLYLNRAMTRLVQMNQLEGQALSRKAAAYLRRAGPGSTGDRPVDRQVLAAYLALAEGDGEQLKRLCAQGARRFAGQLGVEEFWHLLGWISDGPEALQAFDKALAHRPHFPLASFGRASQHLKHKRYRAALADLDRTLALMPRFQFAYNSRGYAKLELGEPAEAIADFDRAIALAPRWAQPWLNRARSREQRDPPGALADCNRALALDPRLARAYYVRANLRRPRDPAGALADYTRSIELEPNAWALTNRGALRQQSGDLGGAISDYNRALAIDAGHLTALVNRAVARVSRGQVALAITDLSRAVRVAPRSGNAWYNYGWALSRARRFAEARQALLEARKLTRGEARKVAEKLLADVEQQLR